MLWQLWLLGDGAHGVSFLRRQGRHGAFVAPGLERHDHSGLPSEALGSTIDQSFLSLRNGLAFRVELHHLMDGLVHPLPCFNVVQASYDHLKIFVKFDWHVLNFVR